MDVNSTKQVKDKRIKFVVRLILVCALCAAAYFGFLLFQVFQMYAEGDRYYDDLRERVLEVQDEPRREDLSANQVSTPSPSVDFQALQDENADTIAWIYSPGTEINYPVVMASDYAWYFEHLLDGTKNANGVPFLDFNSKPDLSGRLNIFYGRDIRTGKMFGSLDEYKNQAYFDAHPTLYLYSEEKSYKINLVYGCSLEDGLWRDRAFMYEINLDALITYASACSTFTSDYQYSDKDAFVVLVASESGLNNVQYLVIGVIDD